MPCLISTSGHLLEFRKFPSRFGTYPDNELVVQDGMGVMGHHFTLRREGVRIVLEAAAEAATSVNGNDVRRANIRDGDRIQVGQLMLIYSNPSGQQNHLAGRLDASGPVALPAPEAQALPAPATSRQKVSPADATKPEPADPPAPITSRQTVPSAAIPPASAQRPANATDATAKQPDQIPPVTSLPAQDSVPTQPSAQAPSQETPPGIHAASKSTAATPNTPNQSVPDGIPTVSETTPSESFMAWANEADAANVSPITERITKAMSAQEGASPPTKVTVPKPNRAHATVPPNSRTAGSSNAPSSETSSVAMPASQTDPENPFANAVVKTGDAPPTGVSGPAESLANSTPQQPANPFEEATEEDLASVFLEADDEAEDLANVFLQDITPEKPAVPEPVPKEDIPDIPKISEAEKVGAIAEASELPAKDISPIGSVLNKRKQAPTPPPPATPVESKATEPVKKSSLAEKKKAAKEKKPKERKPKRKKSKAKSTDSMAGRLTSSKLQPKYRLQIPWHKVAVFLCLVFAAAGAYLATSGQSYVDKYMSMLGLKSDPAHHSYLTRFADVAPNMVLTADADKIVAFYRKWASEENWVTVGDLETKLKEWATGLRLSDLDHVSIATNREGNFVALVSTKTDLSRQDLMRDLGRGVLVSERFGAITIHEGFVGNSQPVKFAILNPKTMVIGDPTMTMQFISAPVVTPKGPPEDHPTISLSKSPKDLLGLYHTDNGLDIVADWFSGPLRPSIDRLFGFIKTEAADQTHLLAQIGGDLRVDARFTFDQKSDAEAFAKGWRRRANRQLGIFTDLLGPRAPRSFDGVAKDLDQCTISTPGDEAKVVLATTNRWATLGSGTLKDTLVHLVESLQQNRPVEDAPSLISPEETQARALAQQIAEKCDLAMAKNSPDVTPGQDISQLISALSRGVNGSGVYRNVSYRVPGAEKLRGRLLQLLEWKGDQLVVVLKDPPVVEIENDGAAMAVKEEG